MYSMCVVIHQAVKLCYKGSKQAIHADCIFCANDNRKIYQIILDIISQCRWIEQIAQLNFKFARRLLRYKQAGHRQVQCYGRLNSFPFKNMRFSGSRQKTPRLTDRYGNFVYLITSVR